MHISINNSISEIHIVHNEFKRFAHHHSCESSFIQKMSIVIDEVLTNIIKHGFEDHLIHVIRIKCEINQDKLIMTFEDDGIKFNPLHFISPRIDADIDSRKVGGLGLHLIKNLVDDIKYAHIDSMNGLTVIKYVQ